MITTTGLEWTYITVLLEMPRTIAVLAGAIEVWTMIRALVSVAAGLMTMANPAAGSAAAPPAKDAEPDAGAANAAGGNTNAGEPGDTSAQPATGEGSGDASAEASIGGQASVKGSAQPPRLSTESDAEGRPPLLDADAPVKTEGEAQGDPERRMSEKDRMRRKDRPWITRWKPERNMLELGVYAGVFLPSERHDLYDPDTAPSEPYWAAAPNVGARIGYFPLSPLGVELEAGAVPTRMRNITNDFALLYGFRGHVVAQLPFYSVVPYFLAGYGLMGVASSIASNGNDVDPAFHYGGGVKVYFNRWVGARFEARNIISATEATQNSGASHVQVIGGVTFTFLRSKPKALPPAPPPVDPDRDKDGFLNETDRCPDDPGVAPAGCPDTDGDGFPDIDDKCVEVPGVAPDGCPVQDTDEDGIYDRDDKCVFRPETWNGFEDEDGCPDDLPPKVKEFSGTIPGIEFEFNEAKIRPSSKPTLDRAAETLEEYPELRVRITGHTDDVGTEEFNLDLSKRRAEAVKQYLVDAGIDADRIQTEGVGSAEPVVPNTSDENRAKNRRIEFEILSSGPQKMGASPKQGGDASADGPKEPAGPADASEPE